MSAPPLQCPKCRATLLGGVFTRDAWGLCPACKVPLQIEVFPALFRSVAAASPAEDVMMDGEAGCFYHPQKKAVIPCGVCGRFLCALCDCEFNGEHLCPTCLETGRKKGRNNRLTDSRVLYRSQALILAFVPLLLTAFVALFYALRFRHEPPSLVSPKPWAMTVAVVVALVQIAGFAILIVVLSTS